MDRVVEVRIVELALYAQTRLRRFAAHDNGVLAGFRILDLVLQRAGVFRQLRERLFEQLQFAGRRLGAFARLVAFDQRGARQIVAAFADRDLGFAFPLAGFFLQPVAAANEFLLVCDGAGRRGADLHEGLLHLLNDQADHLFRIFGLVEQGVQIGIDDVRHAGKYAHLRCLLRLPVRKDSVDFRLFSIRATSASPVSRMMYNDIHTGSPSSEQSRHSRSWWISPTVGRITAMDREVERLLGEAPAFLQVLDDVSKIAPLEKPVLIVGERGTGKELIAARLHYLSNRWDAEFIKMNCAAISDSLLESELFGHEVGRVHRRHAQSPRPLRTRRRRHVVPRRTRDHLEAGAGEDPAHHRIRRVRARRRQQDDARQRAARGGDERRSAGARRQRRVPARSARPARVRRDHAAAAARTPRRHRAAGRTLRHQHGDRTRTDAVPRFHRTRARRAARARLAGQRARTEERRRALCVSQSRSAEAGRRNHARSVRFAVPTARRRAPRRCSCRAEAQKPAPICRSI